MEPLPFTAVSTFTVLQSTNKVIIVKYKELEASMDHARELGDSTTCNIFTFCRFLLPRLPSFRVQGKQCHSKYNVVLKKYIKFKFSFLGCDKGKRKEQIFLFSLKKNKKILYILSKINLVWGLLV